MSTDNRQTQRALTRAKDIALDVLRIANEGAQLQPRITEILPALKGDPDHAALHEALTHLSRVLKELMEISQEFPP